MEWRQPIAHCKACGASWAMPRNEPHHCLVDQARSERDQARRLLNRLDAAINHHKRDCEANDVPDTHDERLWAARDKIINLTAEGEI